MPLEKIRTVLGVSVDQEAQIVLLLIIVAAGYLAAGLVSGYVPGLFIPLVILWTALSLYLTWRLGKTWMGW
ncbi:MAG: hypothetical protein U0R44_06430 [Candidatus Micrarchaeia archaeon]